MIFENDDAGASCQVCLSTQFALVFADSTYTHALPNNIGIGATDVVSMTLELRHMPCGANTELFLNPTDLDNPGSDDRIGVFLPAASANVCSTCSDTVDRCSTTTLTITDRNILDAYNLNGSNIFVFRPVGNNRPTDFNGARDRIHSVDVTIVFE